MADLVAALRGSRDRDNRIRLTPALTSRSGLRDAPSKLRKICATPKCLIAGPEGDVRMPALSMLELIAPEPFDEAQVFLHGPDPY